MLIHENLTYQLNGIFFQIQNKFGPVLKESQYCDLIEAFLKKDHLSYQREIALTKIEGITGNIADFVVDSKLVIEVKAKARLTKLDYWQLKRYLLAANLKLGLLVNFHARHIRPLRVLNRLGCLSQALN